MGPQSAAMEIVMDNFENDLNVSFFDSMTDLMELHKAIKTDGAKTRLRRVGDKFTAVLQARRPRGTRWRRGADGSMRSSAPGTPPTTPPTS